MASPNGVPRLGARSLRVTYDTLTYSIETPDGETASLAGYRHGSGCPISVEIEVEAAYAEYSEDQPTGGDRTSMRYVATAMRAARLLRRNLLVACIPGLDRAVADVLASDDGPWESILTELGWWEQPAEASSEGEAEAGDQILIDWIARIARVLGCYHGLSLTDCKAMTVSEFGALEQTVPQTEARRLMDAAQAALFPHLKKRDFEDLWRRWQEMADPPPPAAAPAALFSWNGRPVTPIDLKRRLAGHLGGTFAAETGMSA